MKGRASKMKPEPLRMCVVTKERLPKGALLRFVEKNGRLVYDPSFSSPGRGLYVKDDEAAVAKFLSEKFRAKSHLPPLDEGERERIGAK